jgi:hypothetical protein
LRLQVVDNKKNELGTYRFAICEKEKWEKGQKLPICLFLLCGLFLLAFGSFSHDINLEAIIVSNLYLKFAKAFA